MTRVVTEARSLRTVSIGGNLVKVPDLTEIAGYTTAQSFDLGGEPVRSDVVFRISVASLADPSSELANYAGSSVGGLLIAYLAGAGTNEYTIYAWDSADSGGADLPYVVAGSSGYWVACGGRYSKSACTVKGNVGTAGVFTVGGTQVVGAQQAHLEDADAAVAAISAISVSAGADSIDRAAFNTALGTLVTEINALKTAYNALAGKFNSWLVISETHGLNASS